MGTDGWIPFFAAVTSLIFTVLFVIDAGIMALRLIELARRKWVVSRVLKRDLALFGWASFLVLGGTLDLAVDPSVRNWTEDPWWIVSTRITGVVVMSYWTWVEISFGVYWPLPRRNLRKTRGPRRGE